MTNKYFVIINNVDNGLKVSIGDGVNMNEIYNKSFHGDPELTDPPINITDFLQPTIKNVIRFQGSNSAYTIPGREKENNPWHFNYRVVKRTFDDNNTMISEVDIIPPYNEKEIGPPNTSISKADRSYPIVKVGNEFVYSEE